MNIIEGKFYGMDRTELFYRSFQPKGDAKAAVIIVHGHGDHSGGLQNLCTYLVENEFVVYAFDLRGHGKSPGKRGFIRSWDEYRGDLYEFRRLVVSEVPELGLFIVGHSLGGAIGLDYALHHGADLAGIIAISPAISYEIKPREKFLINLVAKIKPDYTIKKPSNPHLLTQDNEIIARLQSDALRHNTITPGLGRGLIQTVSNIMNQSASIQMPILMQYGLDDKITPPAKLRQFFDSVGSLEKQKLEYAETRHRPFDDLDRERFLEDMVSWLDRQSGAALDNATALR